MELLYVWVESHKNIKRQGFNFSPNYDFEIKEENGEYILVDNYEEAKKRGDFKYQPKNFFGENISNITAIVGKNGSGKSTIFDFISNLDNDSNIRWSSQAQFIKYLTIYKLGNQNQNEYNDLFFEHWLDKEPQVIPKIKENKIYELESNNRKEYSREQNIQCYVERFYNAEILEAKYTNSDITPWYESLKDFIYKRDLKKPTDFRYTRILKQLKFLGEERNRDFLLKSSNKDIRRLGNIKEVILRGKSNQYIEKWRNVVKEIEDKKDTEIDTKGKFKEEEIIVEKLDSVFRILWDELIREYGKPDNKARPIKAEESSKLTILNWLFSNLLSIREFLMNFELDNRLIETKMGFSSKLKEFIRQIENFDKKKEYKEKYTIFMPLIDINLKDNKYIFYYKDNNYEVKTYFDSELVIGFDFFKYLYEKNSFDLGIIISQFNIGYFPQLSSGAEGLLDLLATFYIDSPSINNNPNESQVLDLLITIDEGEQRFHPEWQRRYINILCSFFTELYPTKNIKIILSSHSPFVASDLPRENVIMLDVYDEKDKETKKDEITQKSEQEIGNCKVVKDKDIKTFGANIFDLYTDAFFVESSFGEFAKVKIKEVVKDLTPNEEGEYSDLTKERICEIQYTIDSIGEKLVSAKLEKLYEEYRNNKNSVEYKKEQLKMLQEKLGLSKEQMIDIIKNGDLND